jgi:hypothetical protein
MNRRLRPLTRGQAKGRAAIIGLAAAAVTSAVTAGVVLNMPPQLDEHLCPIGQPVVSSIAIIADATDPLSLEDQRRFLAIVRDARDNLPRFGKLTLLLLDPKHPYTPVERISLCNPGSPSQLGMLFHTPSKVAKRWHDSFEGPVDAVAAELAKAPRGAASPILEATVGISWRPDFKNNVSDRRIIWMSDMRHFRPQDGLSLYAAGDPWPHFLRSAVARNDPDLRGTIVQIELIHRPAAPLSETDLQKFWVRWFGERAHAAKVIFDGKEIDLDVPQQGAKS